MWRLYVSAALFMAGHLTIQFVAWAYAMREPLAWQITSFPAFVIVGVDLSTRYFWMLLVANSAAWVAVFLLFLKWRIHRRTSTRHD